MPHKTRFDKENLGKTVIIFGGGPAGLTAAYKLSKLGLKSIVLEKDATVGGISRTVDYKGYKFDIGGHRFFTKVAEVEEMWRNVLGKDFIHRKRISRIYYNKTFFNYPLHPSNALSGLGVRNSFLILMSYLKAQLFPEKPELTFQGWVSNRFGKRLFNIFFKTYTEKVWGMPCSEISAEWAAQRIKGLSLVTALKNALVKPKQGNKSTVIKTLIDSFDYPRLGPGMMWEKVCQLVEDANNEVYLNSTVEKIFRKGNRISGVEVADGAHRKLVEGSDFISTIPIRELVKKIEPAVPKKVLQSANKLKYRDFLTVALIINKKNVFPDNWIYIHEPRVKVGRIQNFKNWSPEMVPDSNKTCLGLEYFCFEGDGLWIMPDSDLIDLAREEIEVLGLIEALHVEDGAVVRMPKAYPIYDSTYQEALKEIRHFFSSIENIQLVGRNGMHKYNNQDHSMLTAMLAVKNIFGASYDLWKVNAEQAYHEETVNRKGKEGRDEYAHLASSQPRIPTIVARHPQQASGKFSSEYQVVFRAFSRMDKLGFATAVGLVCSLVIFGMTLWLMIQNNPNATLIAQLLQQYFWGYTLTLTGAFIGMTYGAFWGFIWGWLFAYLRNFIIGLYVFFIKKKTEFLSFTDFLDYY